MKKIYTKTPARIHTCLINESGNGDYIHGGLGFAVNTPCTEILMLSNDNKENDLSILTEEHKQAVNNAIDRLSYYYNKPKVNIKIISSLIPHSGIC